MNLRKGKQTVIDNTNLSLKIELTNICICGASVLIGLSLAYIGLAIVAILVPLWLITGAFRDIGIEADFDMRYSGLIWECAETDCNVIGRSRSAHAAMSFPVRLAAGVFLGCGILLSLLTAHSLSQKAYPRAFVASIVRCKFVGALPVQLCRYQRTNNPIL